MDRYFPATMMADSEDFRHCFPSQRFANFRGNFWALAKLARHVGAIRTSRATVCLSTGIWPVWSAILLSPTGI